MLRNASTSHVTKQPTNLYDYLSNAMENNKKTNTNSNKNTISCEGKVNNSYEPVAGTNCTKFYQCNSGFVYYFECPSGLFFDVRENACNYNSVLYCLV